MDQRNAGESTAPVTAGDGWHTYTEDHLALLDHLEIERAHLMGGCIGGPYCFGVIERAPGRVASRGPPAVHRQRRHQPRGLLRDIRRVGERDEGVHAVRVRRGVDELPGEHVRPGFRLQRLARLRRDLQDAAPRADGERPVPPGGHIPRQSRTSPRTRGSSNTGRIRKRTARSPPCSSSCGRTPRSNPVPALHDPSSRKAGAMSMLG